MGCVGSKGTPVMRKSSKLPQDIDAGVYEETQKRASFAQDSIINDGRTEHNSKTQPMVIDGFHFQYSCVSKRGNYPDQPDKPNQDSYCAIPYLTQKAGFFAVFDGHGEDGHSCAWYARDTLPARMLEELEGKEERCEGIIKQAHIDTNEALHREHSINDLMSGTTAVGLMITPGRKVLISNVGDSRAMLISESDGTLTGRPLSNDQTPYRRDERERCKAAGARIRTMGQLDSPDPIDESQWDQINLLNEIDLEGDPPRVWLPNDRLPGCAFTRSIGDSVAERVGCFAEPEIDQLYLQDNDKYLVLASDGVFEFMKITEITEIISKLIDPLVACKAIAEDAYNRWMKYEGRSDDITIIILSCGGVCLEESGIDPSLITLSESNSHEKISGKARGRKSLAIGGR